VTSSRGHGFKYSSRSRLLLTVEVDSHAFSRGFMHLDARSEAPTADALDRKRWKKLCTATLAQQRHLALMLQSR
jgi:hypothetical protein